MNKKNIKASKRYYYIKKLLSGEKGGYSERLGMFYFNEKAINFITKRSYKYFANEYYDMDYETILANINEFDNLKAFKKDLYEQYKPYYASAWYEQMIEVLVR